MGIPKIERGPLVYNLNTYIMVAGFLLTIAGGLIAWGFVVSEFRSALDAHGADIDRLDRRVTALEGTTRILDNHELRISNVEKQATDAATAMRAVEAALNGLAADMKVTREILQRIEAAQSRRVPP